MRNRITFATKALALAGASTLMALSAGSAFAQSGNFAVGSESASKSVLAVYGFGQPNAVTATVGGIGCPTCDIPFIPNIYFGAEVDVSTSGDFIAGATGKATLGGLKVGYNSSPSFSVTPLGDGTARFSRTGARSGDVVNSTVTSTGGTGVSGALTLSADIGFGLHAAGCFGSCVNYTDAAELKLNGYQPLTFDTAGTGSVSILGVPITDLTAAEPLLAKGNNWGTVTFANTTTALSGLDSGSSGVKVSDTMTANLDFANVIGYVNTVALQKSVSLGSIGDLGYSILSLPATVTANLTEEDIARLSVADYGVSFFNADGSDATIPYISNGILHYAHSLSQFLLDDDLLRIGDGSTDLSGIVARSYTTYGLDLQRTGTLDLETSIGGKMFDLTFPFGVGSTGYAIDFGTFHDSYNAKLIDTDNTYYFTDNADFSLPDLAPPPVTGIGGGVPEPGAWALMLAGFSVLGSALRRRRPALVAG